MRGGGHEPYNTVIGFGAGFKASVAISGFSGPNTLVSGTNVNFSVGASFLPVTPEDPITAIPYDHRSIDFMKITIGGQPNPAIERNPGEVLGGFQQYNVRFASTHFAHDATVVLRLEAKFRCWMTGSSNYDVKILEVTVPVKVYNVCLIQATKVHADGSFAGDPPAALSAPGVARVLAGVAEADFSLMMHNVLPASDPKFWVSQPQFATLLAQSTAFVTMTHGAPDGIWDSDGLLVTWSDIAGFTDRPASVPIHNIAIVYGCATLAGAGALLAPLSFHIVLPLGGPKPDRAYLGFADAVSPFLLHPLGSFMDAHANRMFELLRAGATVKEALDETNSQFVSGYLGPNGPVKVPLIWKGDPYTRLIAVYLTAVERQALEAADRGQEVNSWHYVTP